MTGDEKEIGGEDNLFCSFLEYFHFSKNSTDFRQYEAKNGNAKRHISGLAHCTSAFYFF